MSELRRDYLESHFTIIPSFVDVKAGTARAPQRKSGDVGSLPPAEIVLKKAPSGSIIKLKEVPSEGAEEWDVKVTPSPNPLVDLTTLQSKDVGLPFRRVDPIIGNHYLVVLSPKYGGRLSKVGIDELSLVLLAVQEFGKDLYSRKGINYVMIYYEEDGDQETLYPIHMIGVSELPPNVVREMQAYKKSLKESGICPLCAITEFEKRGPRELVSNDAFMSLAPWAPSSTFEAWVVPFSHRLRFFQLTHVKITKLAEVLAPTLNAMANVSRRGFHMAFFTNSLKRTSMNMHWCIRLMSGGANLEGIYLSYGFRVVDEKPEDKARQLARVARKAMADLILHRHKHAVKKVLE